MGRAKGPHRYFSFVETEYGQCTIVSASIFITA